MHYINIFVNDKRSPTGLIRIAAGYTEVAFRYYCSTVLGSTRQVSIKCIDEDSYHLSSDPVMDDNELAGAVNELSLIEAICAINGNRAGTKQLIDRLVGKTAGDRAFILNTELYIAITKEEWIR